jgi:hypothetical protein
MPHGPASTKNPDYIIPTVLSNSLVILTAERISIYILCALSSKSTQFTIKYERRRIEFSSIISVGLKDLNSFSDETTSLMQPTLAVISQQVTQTQEGIMKIGKSHITSIGLVLMLATSLLSGGCGTKTAKSDDMSSSLTQRAEAAADRADQAALRAEQAATKAEMMAEKCDQIFQKKMKK